MSNAWGTSWIASGSDPWNGAWGASVTPPPPVITGGAAGGGIALTWIAREARQDHKAKPSAPRRRLAVRVRCQPGRLIVAGADPEATTFTPHDPMATTIVAHAPAIRLAARAVGTPGVIHWGGEAEAARQTRRRVEEEWLLLAD